MVRRGASGALADLFTSQCDMGASRSVGAAVVVERSEPHPEVSAADRRKIGVLTLHRCINYGSYWQTRMLVEGLRARGHDAVVLDHDSWPIKKAEWACGLRPRLPASGSADEAARYAVKIARFTLARSAVPRSRRFPLDRPAEMGRYDVVIVGSDEVWNLAHPMYAGCPLFFGEGVPANRLVSYAASFGSYPAAYGLSSEWASRLQRFAAISVRDDNSRRLLRDALGREVPIALDPCLLPFPLPAGRRWRGPDGPFVAVYGHSFSPSFVVRVRRWAAAHPIPLVSVGYRNDWADRQWLTASPDDFANCMARADAVATNFFHGCVFSLRERKPFMCEPSPYRSNKIHGLLGLLGAESHLVADGARSAEVDALMTEPPRDQVMQRLEGLREASERYLTRALA